MSHNTATGEHKGFATRKHTLIIGADRPAAASGQMFDVLDPSDGTRLGSVARGAAQDVDRAVLAARQAFEGPWSKITPSERGRLIWKLSELIMDHANELATINTCLLYTSPSPRDS